MLNVPDSMGWLDATLLLALLIGIGFVVSWLATDVVRMRRGPYIAVLAVATGGAVAITVALAKVPLADLLGHRWPQGLLAAAVTGAIVGIALRKMPGNLPRSGRALHVAEAWEGVVYGLAEGVLLSALPTFVVWQAASDDAWPTGATWAASLAASAAMIAIHHFGYWDYRNRHVLIVVGGCLVLTAGYLASGSLVAPALGHVVMHLAGITRGVELPPHEHVAQAVHA